MYSTSAGVIRHSNCCFEHHTFCYDHHWYLPAWWKPISQRQSPSFLFSLRSALSSSRWEFGLGSSLGNRIELGILWLFGVSRIRVCLRAASLPPSVLQRVRGEFWPRSDHCLRWWSALYRVNRENSIRFIIALKHWVEDCQIVFPRDLNTTCGLSGCVLKIVCSRLTNLRRCSSHDCLRKLEQS